MADQIKPIKTIYLDSPMFMKADPNDPKRYVVRPKSNEEQDIQDSHQELLNKPEPKFNSVMGMLNKKQELGALTDMDRMRRATTQEQRNTQKQVADHYNLAKNDLKKEYGINDDAFVDNLMEYDDIDAEDERLLLDRDMKNPNLTTEQKDLIMQHNTRSRTENR